MNKLESMARKCVEDGDQHAVFVHDQWNRRAGIGDLKGIADPYDKPRETITLMLSARILAVAKEEMVSRAYASIRLCKRLTNRCVTYYLYKYLDMGKWLGDYINNDARFDHDHQLLCCKKGKSSWKKQSRNTK